MLYKEDGKIRGYCKMNFLNNIYYGNDALIYIVGILYFTVSSFLFVTLNVKPLVSS